MDLPGRLMAIKSMNFPTKFSPRTFSIIIVNLFNWISIHLVFCPGECGRDGDKGVEFNFVNYHWWVWYHCSTDAMMHSSLASLRRWTEVSRAAWYPSACQTCVRSSRESWSHCWNWNCWPSAAPIAPVSGTLRGDSETRPGEQGEKGERNDFSIIWFDCENLINVLSGTSIGTSGAAAFCLWG